MKEVILYILTMIPLWITEAIGPLLQNWILAIPEGQ
jgi:hypothetical protein